MTLTEAPSPVAVGWNRLDEHRASKFHLHVADRLSSLSDGTNRWFSASAGEVHFGDVVSDLDGL